MTSLGAQGPSAIALLGSGPTSDAGLGHRLGLAERFSEHGLAIAWSGSPDHSFYACERIVCLVEGALYEIGGAAIDNADGQAARLLADGYRRVGEEVFNRVRGEYWALLWEPQRRAGALVADHLGSRCPHFARGGGRLVVASEIRDVLAALPAAPAPNPLALAHWVMITPPPGDETLFSGVFRLPAGHLLALGESSAAPRRYWSPVYRRPFRRAVPELRTELLQRLTQAVSRRVGDGRGAGVRLSGGLDSSVVAALASRQGRRLRAYSAVFPAYPTIDESALIDLTVGHLGLDCTSFAVRGGSVIGGALDYLDTWRVPPSSPNLFFWTPLIGRAAADGVTVLLDGEGGDELFGFSPFLLADMLRRGRLRSVRALVHRWPTGLPATRGRISYRLTQFAVRGAVPATAHRLMRHIRGAEQYLPAWMPDALGRAWLASERSQFEWKQLAGPRWWTFLVAAVTRGAGPALVYDQTRRMTAVHGVQARHPLVDVDVVDFMLRVPPSIAFDPRYNRPLLRECVAGLLPDEVRLRRHKSSFDALFHQLLAGPELPVTRALLDPAQAELRGYLDMDCVQRELFTRAPPQDPQSRQEWALRVWRLLTAECWLRSQADPAFGTRLRESGQLAATELEIVRSDRSAVAPSVDSGPRRAYPWDSTSRSRREQNEGKQMRESKPEYVTPELVDYGTLTDLTQTNGLTDAEDGCGKQVIHSDGSNACIIR